MSTETQRIFLFSKIFDFFGIFFDIFPLLLIIQGNQTLDTIKRSTAKRNEGKP